MCFHGKQTRQILWLEAIYASGLRDSASSINFTLFGKTGKRRSSRSGPRSLLGDRDDSMLARTTIVETLTLNQRPIPKEFVEKKNRLAELFGFHQDKMTLEFYAPKPRKLVIWLSTQHNSAEVVREAKEQARGNTFLQQHQRWREHSRLDGGEVHMKKGI